MADLAANIPQVQIPDSFNAPIRHPMPVVPPMPVISKGRRGRGRGRGRAQSPLPPSSIEQPLLAQSMATVPVRVSASSDDPFSMNVETTAGHNIAQVQLPAASNWDRNSVP